MNKKLYVGGLSYSTTDDSLRAAFEQAGKVESANVILDKMSGRSRGFGFVEMSSEDEAGKAIEMYNGKEIDGRKVTVNESRPQKSFQENRGGGRDFGGNRERSW
jgi:RNA recognition motif-containing protein